VLRPCLPRADRLMVNGLLSAALRAYHGRTGVASRVNSRASVWPPMITLAMVLFVPEPAPLEKPSGNMPATKLGWS